MSLFSRLAAWISALFAPAPERVPGRPAIPEPPIAFSSVTSLDKPPRNEEIAAGQLYYVANGDKPKWSLFKFPCGCGSVVTLSLQHVHRPPLTAILHRRRAGDAVPVGVAR